MAPIRIDVEGVGGVKLTTDAELDKWLTKMGVDALLDSDGDQVVGFATLVDGSRYTLGPLILQQQQPPQPQQAGITDLLEEAKGGPLTDSEIDFVLANHSRYIDEILGKTDQRERSRLASRLWLRLCVRIKTQTRLAVRGQYLFDGPVPGAFGRAGTEVQFAVRGSSLFCAKTMLETGDLHREHMIASRIHSNQTCPTVMPVLDMIDLPGEPRPITMVTPYYPIPLAPLANGNLHEEGCVNVALCGLATIKAFHRKGICHGDIKPGNMMLTARSDNVVITIDFGSAVEYGESLVSVTPQFGLNCPLEGSLKYDLTCLASSLYVICTGEKLPETSKHLLEKLVGGNRKLPPTLQIVMICLQINDIDSVWESAKVCIEAADGMDHSLMVRHDTIWPKVR
ncbi:serine/threonine protein kinase-like protein [Nitzschia inconspicua]|uniref:Serine/threonine protein kinase-like protein n=1 Tax=Nitzschia inconspicua TaxID=303405 RepID=A0A9K3L826_9STRA|nr:serine/threonine protein kinase-like protein [Nitzschia inconspicua]KAG7356508.1 serine/threonine protein kinase-like protein [Nitzschia inconspicua]